MSKLADSQAELAHPSMAYDSRQIANCFIRFVRDDGRPVFVTALMKLVYIAHGWTLALIDRPLVSDQIEAWRYGPVIPGIYHDFREGLFHIDEKPIDNARTSIVRQTYNIYGHMSARQHIWSYERKATNQFDPHSGWTLGHRHQSAGSCHPE